MSVKRGHIAVGVGRCYVEWSIHFFVESPQVNENWISPTFNLSDATWCLRLYPNGRSNDSAGQIYLYLVMQELESEICNISFKLGVIAKNDQQYTPINCTHSYSNSEYLHGGILLKRSEILRDRNFFPGGVVTFFCEAVVEGGGENKVDAETQTSLRDGCSYLMRDLKEMFLKEEGADVTIKVKGKQFRAHSQILSARSSVFAPMFRQDAKEKNNGVLEIPEYDPDVFREFLIFLYSGQAEKLSSDNDIDLYSAADKYNLKELKTICSEFMKENITVDSFCDVLSLAIRHCDKDLMDFLTDYFVKNVKTIIVSLKWMSFAKEHPIESNQLVIKLAHYFLPN